MATTIENVRKAQETGMHIELFKFDQEIRAMDLEEITSTNILNRNNMPEDSGLASYEIFGTPGTSERKSTYAYIDLNDIFIHPHVFQVLKYYKRAFESLVYGREVYYVDAGEIKVYKENDVKIPKGVKKGTGVRFLKSIWKDLDFKILKGEAPLTRDRKEFLGGLTPNEIFITKFLVCPPFYREVDLSTNGKKNEINVLYTRILSTAHMIKQSTIMDLMVHSQTHNQMMDNIMVLYDYFIGIVGGVHGMIQKDVYGKGTSFSARLVLTSPTYAVESWKDLSVPFDTTVIPLHVAIKCYAPFIVNAVREIFDSALKGSTFIYVYNKKTGKSTRKSLSENYRERLSNLAIYEMIDVYYKSPSRRLDILTVETEDGAEVPLMYFDDTSNKINIVDNDDIATKIEDQPNGAITMTHLFYMAAASRLQNKAGYVTRFPVEDYHNMVPYKVKVVSYPKSMTATINGISYKGFPDIDLEHDRKQIESLFINSIQVFSAHLGGFGADFDGDQVSFQPIFADDATKDCLEYAVSNTNIINIAGGTMRGDSQIVKHTMYAYTRDPK